MLMVFAVAPVLAKLEVNEADITFGTGREREQK
jgi:hypothetical protein